MSYPTDVQAERMGFRVLWDAQKRSCLSVHVGGDAAQDIREERDTVMRMVRSHVEGIAYFKTEQGIQHEGLEQVSAEPTIRTISKAPTNLQAGFHFRAVSDHQGSRGNLRYVAAAPEIRNHKPEEFMDPSFVAELEKSGFIKKLYEQK